VSTKRKRPVVSLDVAEIDALLARIEPKIAKADHEKLTAMAATLVEVARLVRDERATNARLRQMLGQTSSEKTAAVLGTDANGSVPGATNDSATTTTEETTPPPAGETTQDTSSKPANDTNGAAEGGKRRRKNHGRTPIAAYAANVIAVQHQHLHEKQVCPGCALGKLYPQDPSSCLRFFGQAPLVAVRWDCECLRCNGCGHVYTAALPEQGRGPKYSESAASMMAVLRYGLGLPLNRIQMMQHWFQVPVPASIQWEVVRDRVPDLWPVYDTLVELAANADVLYNDDTSVRILELMGKRRAQLVAKGELDEPDRTGLFTSGLVATTPWGPIALYASGRQHAGENADDLLVHRDPALPIPIGMWDGADRNVPCDDHPMLVSNCLAHGRRHVVKEVENHPELCAHLLREVGKVFANDATCRKEKLSGKERLDFHERKSGPVMDALRRWIQEQFDTKRVEPNSGLGGAFSYLLKRWDALTLFLRVLDAPLDNNMSERSLKRAIRHRNNSLFYLTRRGALVGDVYMALIHTTELHSGDPFRYLTALFTYAKEVAAHPEDWLPWNYLAALERLANPSPAAA
jgi:transposase